jgi:hypothetical protein
MVGNCKPLQNQPNFSADTMLLLTDGTVMCHEVLTDGTGTNRWHRY